MLKIYRDKSARDIAGFWLPADRALSLILMLLVNLAVYYPFQVFGSLYPRIDITSDLDRKISLGPNWIFVYVAAYIFWGLCYFAVAHYENWYNILSAELAAKLICGVFFLLLPTTLTRGEPAGNSFAEQVLLLLYQIDEPTNLFPSIHCMDSLICSYCVFRKDSLSPVLRWFCAVLTVLICISVVKTHQHVLADIFSGVILAYLMLYIARKKGWGSWMQCRMQKLAGAFTGRR